MARAVPLDEVLTLARDAVKVDPGGEYPNLGIYSFGRGVFPKPPILGSATSAATLYRVRSGQFIYSRLFAFEGAFAVVPPEMDGAFVSNEYPTFDVDTSQALVEFVRLAICRRATWEELAARTVGMGHRRQRLQPDALLSFDLELPSLDEQSRVVGAVGAAERVARTARREAESAKVLAEAVFGEVAASVRDVRLGELVTLDVDRVPVVSDANYAIAGVAIAGGGLFWRDEIRGDDTTYPALHQLRKDQLVYRKLTAWEGPITVVPAAFDGAFVSPEFPTFAIDTTRLLPDFMRFLCQRPGFHAEMKARATGTAERRNRLKPQDLMEIRIGLPPLDDQRRIAAVFQTALRLETETERATATALALQESLLSGESRIGGTVAA